jgi:hypothetical protein
VVAATGFLAVIAVIAGNFAVSYYLWFVSVPLLLWLTFLVFHSVRRGRPDRLSFLGVVLAAGVVAGTIVIIQVFGNPYTTQPRDEELVALVKKTWAGLGLDLDSMYLEPYSYEDREDSPRCDQLPERDRWEAHRGGFGQVEDPLRLESTARSRLTGWAVERYEGTSSSPEVLLWVSRRDVVLEIELSDQKVNLEASAGPCAVPSNQVGESRFWRRAERQ